MAAPLGISPPSHVLFADDIMVFLQGKPSHLRNLLSFMDEYALNSGQVINKAKSHLFLGKHALLRQNMISRLLGINVGKLPFIYLGVPIFTGHPKSEHLASIADKVRCKLSSWKGRQLSQAGRLQLISSVIHSILTYSFHVYEWSKSLLKKVQRWIRNFFWNGDPLKDGSALIAWNTFINMGLQPYSYYKKSSVWLGLKKLWPTLLEGVQWLVGDGKSIRFWRDNWLGETLVTSLNYDQEVHELLNDKVSCFIKNGQWNLPSSFCRTLPATAQSIRSIELPVEPTSDQVV
ncbi:uncharacterized protein LOC133737421 [Rosa rugosa]|uniref:uncharacterized protein LOC133737421 n=1 Tax=Rosa rugosa TaxID=74645 RepID=UPI002B40837A|nr:uncharacterized protein LOC133737421 [Rosa rugosa]